LSYLNQRDALFAINANTRLSFSRLIDLFILKNLEPERVEAILDEYAQLTTVETYALGFHAWEKELDYLQLSEVQLTALFVDVQRWLATVMEGGEVKWGRLVIELLQMCRVKASLQSSGFIAALAGDALIQRIVKWAPEFNLMHLAINLLKHLMDIELIIDKPDPWRRWIGDVEKVMVSGRAEKNERFVWVMSESHTLIPKVQKKGKNGWSQGRKLPLSSLGYEYEDLLTERDLMLIHHYERGYYGSRDGYPLSKEVVELLVKQTNIVTPEGQSLAIVPEPSLLIIGEFEGMLKLSRFPQGARTPSSLLTERTPSIYT
ncbi:hypothetical protein ACPV5V_20130, partial [Vibrio campbellii]